MADPADELQALRDAAAARVKKTQNQIVQAKAAQKAASRPPAPVPVASPYVAVTPGKPLLATIPGPYTTPYTSPTVVTRPSVTGTKAATTTAPASTSGTFTLSQISNLGLVGDFATILSDSRMEQVGKFPAKRAAIFVVRELFSRLRLKGGSRKAALEVFKGLGSTMISQEYMDKVIVEIIQTSEEIETKIPDMFKNPHISVRIGIANDRQFADVMRTLLRSGQYEGLFVDGYLTGLAKAINGERQAAADSADFKQFSDALDHQLNRNDVFTGKDYNPLEVGYKQSSDLWADMIQCPISYGNSFIDILTLWFASTQSLSSDTLPVSICAELLYQFSRSLQLLKEGMTKIDLDSKTAATLNTEDTWFAEVDKPLDAVARRTTSLFDVNAGTRWIEFAALGMSKTTKKGRYAKQVRDHLVKIFSKNSFEAHSDLYVHYAALANTVSGDKKYIDAIHDHFEQVFNREIAQARIVATAGIDDPKDADSIIKMAFDYLDMLNLLLVEPSIRDILTSSGDGHVYKIDIGSIVDKPAIDVAVRPSDQLINIQNDLGGAKAIEDILPSVAGSIELSNSGLYKATVKKFGSTVVNGKDGIGIVEQVVEQFERILVACYNDGSSAKLDGSFTLASVLKTRIHPKFMLNYVLILLGNAWNPGDTLVAMSPDISPGHTFFEFLAEFLKTNTDAAMHFLSKELGFGEGITLDFNLLTFPKSLVEFIRTPATTKPEKEAQELRIKSWIYGSIIRRFLTLAALDFDPAGIIKYLNTAPSECKSVLTPMIVRGAGLLGLLSGTLPAKALGGIVVMAPNVPAQLPDLADPSHLSPARVIIPYLVTTLRDVINLSISDIQFKEHHNRVIRRSIMRYCHRLGHHFVESLKSLGIEKDKITDKVDAMSHAHREGILTAMGTTMLLTYKSTFKDAAWENDTSKPGVDRNVIKYLEDSLERSIDGKSRDVVENKPYIIHAMYKTMKEWVTEPGVIASVMMNTKIPWDTASFDWFKELAESLATSIGDALFQKSFVFKIKIDDTTFRYKWAMDATQAGEILAGMAPIIAAIDAGVALGLETIAMMAGPSIEKEIDPIIVSCVDTLDKNADYKDLLKTFRVDSAQIRKRLLEHFDTKPKDILGLPKFTLKPTTLEEFMKEYNLTPAEFTPIVSNIALSSDHMTTELTSAQLQPTESLKVEATLQTTESAKPEIQVSATESPNIPPLEPTEAPHGNNKDYAYTKKKGTEEYTYENKATSPTEANSAGCHYTESNASDVSPTGSLAIASENLVQRTESIASDKSWESWGSDIDSGSTSSFEHISPGSDSPAVVSAAECDKPHGNIWDKLTGVNAKFTPM